MDYLEIAIFVIAMVVAFLHWLFKESGLFNRRKNSEQAELQEQMRDLHVRRATTGEQQGRGAPQNDEDADWRALREAMGLPADEQPIFTPYRRADAPEREQEVIRVPSYTEEPYRQEEPAPVPEPAPVLAPVRQAKLRAPERDFYEIETEGPAPRPQPVPTSAAGELYPPLTADEVAIIRTLRKTGTSKEDARILAQEIASGLSVADAETERMNESAYDIPDGRHSRSRGQGGGGRRTGANAGLRRLLRTPEGVRQVMLAREILGTPKAWEQPEFNKERAQFKK